MVTVPVDRRPSKPMLGLAAHACLIAKDAAYNLREYVSNSSNLALLTVRQCEHELDQIERDVDDKVPEAMVRVGERTVRELLAAIRFITDLERIGDLLLWVADRSTVRELDQEDSDDVVQMLTTLEEMLQHAHDGLLQRDLECATRILRQDRELDTIRRRAFHRHLRGRSRHSRTESVDVLFIVQSIERAGDHATNLAEEIVHLVEHRSIRHKRRNQVEG
jgi:phosphate transport system protein